MKTEILSAENKWQQTQFNGKMGKYGKIKLKNIVKYNLFLKKVNRKMCQKTINRIKINKK
jgi:hypothetical protein